MKEHDEVLRMIERNAKDILDGQTTDRGVIRAAACLGAVVAEMLLDIRDQLDTLGQILESE